MRSLPMVLALAFVMANGFVASAVRAEDAKVMQDRQALMKEQAADMGAVKGYLDDKNDLAKATAAATDLPQTMNKLPDVFPPGTAGQNPDGKYETKGDVWSDWKGFLEQRDVAAKKAEILLAAVKGGDKPAIQEAFADLGKNGCGGCHQKFRVEIKK